MSNARKKQRNRFVGMLLTFCLVITTVCAPLPGMVVDTHASDKQTTTQTGRPLQAVKLPDDESQIVKVTDQSQLRNTVKGTYYQLQNDIVSEGSDESFQGILDGNGHTITLTGKHLFKRVEKEGIVQNVHFEGTVGEPGAEDGPLGWLVKGAVLNCSSAITGEYAVGFAKRIEEGVFSNCIAYGKAGNGAILKAYGGIDWETEDGKEYKGTISSSYWIPTAKDPAIDAKDLIDGSSKKTETELKSKEIVKLLNEKRGDYGTAWGQNGKTGYPYFGEDQTYNPDQVEVPESQYTVKFGKDAQSATKIKENRLDVSRYDLTPADNRVIGMLFLEGIKPEDQVIWSSYSVTNEAIAVNENGQVMLFNDGEGIAKAQVNGQDVAWVKIFSHPKKIEDIKLYIGEEEVTGKEYTIQGSEWTNLSVKAKYEGEAQYKDAYFEKFRFEYENRGLLQNSGGPEFSFMQPGTSKVTVTSLDDETKKATVTITSAYVPIESVQPDIPDFNELHARSSMGDGRAFDAIETNGVIILPENASVKTGFHVTSSNPNIAEFSPALPIGYLPFKPGKVTFTASIEDRDPLTGKTRTLTGTRDVTFQYKNPLTDIQVKSEKIKVKEFEKTPLDLTFTGAISKDGWSVTEPELIWTYEGNGEVAIERENLYAQNREDVYPNDKGYWMASTQYTVKGLKEGNVIATGTPLDQTNKIKPIQIEITVSKGNATNMEVSDLVKKGKETAAQYLIDQRAEKGYKFGNEWEVFSLLRAGYALPEKQLEAYYESVVQKVQTWDETVKPSDVERVALTLLMMKKEITDVEGVDLAQLIYNSPKLTDGTNELCWALLALDAQATKIPEEARWTREKMVAELLKWQNKDGGFPLFAKGSSGVDVTAMVLQSLAPYQEKAEVQEGIEKGLSYLAKAIQPKFDAGSAEATAQVLLTLSVLGKDAASEKEFSTKYDNTITALMEYFVEGQGFKHAKDSNKTNQMATIQALQGLDAYEHFLANQKYWDLSQVGGTVNPEPQPQPEPEPQPEVKEGKIVLTVERFTIGQGYFKEPVFVPFEKGENGADLLKKVIGAKNYVGEDAYVQGIKGADQGPEKTTIPDYITNMGEGAPTTESARAYYDAEGKNQWEKGTLGEFTYSSSAGWFYTVNGATPIYGISEYEPQDGDVVRFQYTVHGYGADLTGKLYGQEEPSVRISDKNPLTKLLAEVNSQKEELLQKEEIKHAYQSAMELMPDMTAPQEKVDAAMKALQDALKNVDAQSKPEQPERPEQSPRPEGTAHFRPVVLTDQKTGIILTGQNLERSMNLKVTPLKNTDRQVGLMRAQASKTQWIVRLNNIQLMDNGTEVTNHGKITLYLPLSKIYTGNRMTVVHCMNGKVELLKGEVIDGFVKLELTDLQGFGIIIDPVSTTDIYKKIA